jgi:peptidoglycan-associated lipoprotein
MNRFPLESKSMRTCDSRPRGILTLTLAIAVLGSACVRNPPPVEPEAPVPPPSADRVTPPPSPPPSPPPVLEEPSPQPRLVPEDDFASRSLEGLNRESPLEPAFFGYDSSQIEGSARSVLEANAEILSRYPTWIVTIEGHCDERGTAEYNLGLGERRALAAREYLMEIGVPGSRLRTVSYGKEFPFDPGNNDASWSRNRRAHFVVTAK